MQNIKHYVGFCCDHLEWNKKRPNTVAARWPCLFFLCIVCEIIRVSDVANKELEERQESSALVVLADVPEKHMGTRKASAGIPSGNYSWDRAGLLCVVIKCLTGRWAHFRHIPLIEEGNSVTKIYVPESLGLSTFASKTSEISDKIANAHTL